LEIGRLALAAGLIGIAAAAFAVFPRWHNQAVSQSAAPANVLAKSIAVLPFRNLSEDKENAFFADGIQDDLVTSLARIMIKILVATREHFGESRVRQRKSRVQRDCVSVALFGRDVVVARDLGSHLELTAAEIHDVGIRIVGQFRFHLRLFLRAKLRRQRSGDFCRRLAERSNPAAFGRNGPTRLAVLSLRRSIAH
jgi:hypothetical protein